jgi:sugar (pentulose or hexulose) kinase
MLGLDVGTTSIKAALYSSDGVQHHAAETPVPIVRPKTGWAEQDMETVWQCARDVLSRVAAAADGATICSLGIAAQGDGLWMLDMHDNPVGNAILWSDTRAGSRIADQAKDGRSVAVARACNTSNWPGASGSIYSWLKDHDRQMSSQSVHIVYCSDWIGYRLTGNLATDKANSTIPFLDLSTKTWSADAFDALGCQEMMGKIQPPSHADSVLGHISADVAGETGLPEDLPVSVGTLDLGAMIVGMAMDQPGQTMMILGTTAVVNILAKSVTGSDTPVGATACHSTEDLVIRILAPTTGAAAFDWFTSLHSQSLGGDSPDQIARKLNALVEHVPPGSNGVTFLPYLNGERAPFVASNARASFHGISATTTKADMGRAVMEGTAMSLRHCFKSEGGLPKEPVQLTGGGARNALWCDIVADCLGVPVEVSELTDHGLWGAACIGAAAAGRGRACALAKRSENRRIHSPNLKTHQHYNALFERYAAISAASVPIWDLS